MNRCYLNVPYSEKDEAKRLGARWDPNKKSWYITPDNNSSLFTKWLPRSPSLKDDESLLQSEIYLVEASQRCFKCGQWTKVIGFGVEEDEKIKIAETVSPLPEKLLSYLDKTYRYYEGYSKTTESVYLGNHCQHCGVLQGGWFLFNELDSPFYIDSMAKAKNLTLYPLRFKNDEVVSVEGVFPLVVTVGYEVNPYLISDFSKFIDDEKINSFF